MNFPDFEPLNRRSDEDLDQHCQSQFCCRRIWPFNSDPKWPHDDIRSKIPEHREEPPTKDPFTQVSSMSIKLCRQSSFLAYWNNDPNSPPYDLWPISPENP